MNGKMKRLAGGMEYLSHNRIIGNVILPVDPGRAGHLRKMKQKGLSGQEHRQVLLFRKFGSCRHAVFLRVFLQFFVQLTVAVAMQFRPVFIFTKLRSNIVLLQFEGRIGQELIEKLRHDGQHQQYGQSFFHFCK